MVGGVDGRWWEELVEGGGRSWWKVVGGVDGRWWEELMEGGGRS